MSTRLPPQMPQSRVLTSLQRAPLRTLILILSVCGIGWGLAFGIQSFEDIAFDRSANGGGSLVTFDIIIGALFCGFAVLMIVGFFAGAMNRPSLARIFAYLSILAALALAVGHLFIIIAHFRFQSQILAECTTAATNLTVVSGNPFWFGYTSHTLSAADAATFCNGAYSRQSISSIVWLLAALVAGAIFCAIALAWSYQILDPSYGRSRTTQRTAGRSDIRMGSFYPNGAPRYDPHPASTSGAQDPFSTSRERDDAFVPPYDANMPPKYAGSVAEGREGFVGSGAGAEKDREALYGAGGEERDWTLSDADLAGPRIQERRGEDV